MKRIISIITLVLMFITQVGAVNLDNVVEKLNESSDYANVTQESATTVCAIINSLLNANQVSPEDLDWSAAYKIYTTESDIFSLQSSSEESIMSALDSYIWCYPAQINGRDIRVTISKAQMPDYNLVEQGVLSEQEYSDMVDEAGTWIAPQGEIDTLKTNENIEAWLQSAGVLDTDSLILVGGSPKMRTLSAITFVDGQADKIIPLAPSGIELNSASNEDRSGDADKSLQVGEAYDFEEVAQALSMVDVSDADDTGGNAINNPAGLNIKVISIVVIIGLCIVGAFLIKRIHHPINVRIRTI